MIPIKTTSGVSFFQQERDTILSGAENSDVVLAHSCRTGRCGVCKCKVVSGDTISVVEELALTEKEKKNGWILACARSATSNLEIEIEIEDFGDLKFAKAAMFPCKVHSIKMMAEHVIRVELRLPPASEFKINSGQYVDIIGPSGVMRSYSVANYVTENILELHIGKVEGGRFSDYWFGEVEINDLLRLNGPLGTFTLRSVKGQNVVFLATGTGIAPIKAMIEGAKFLAPEDQPKSLTVFWGGRSLEDLYFDPSVVDESVRYIPSLSRWSPDWEGETGYVQDVFLNESPDLSNCVVYACGSDNMIRSSFKKLTDAGLSERNFFSDAFVTSGPQ